MEKTDKISASQPEKNQHSVKGMLPLLNYLIEHLTEVKIKISSKSEVADNGFERPKNSSDELELESINEPLTQFFKVNIFMSTFI